VAHGPNFIQTRSNIKGKRKHRQDRTLLSFERVLLLSTAWPRWISGQVLSSHSVVSSSRTVRPCSPWGGRWIGQSRTQALGRVIPGVCVPVSGIKVRSLVGLSAHSACHWWSVHCAARMLLSSEKLMRCCAAGTNRCLDLRRRATALVGTRQWKPNEWDLHQHSVGSRRRGEKIAKLLDCAIHAGIELSP